MNVPYFRCFLMVLIVSGLSVFSLKSVSAGRLFVTEDIELNASVNTVWKLIGGFNNLDVWHPVVVDSEMHGKGIKPGDIRILTLGNGTKITEKLIALSDTKKTYTYTMTDSPLPVMDYVSTISVSKTKSGKSRVEWKSTFNAINAPEAKAIETIAGVYIAGLNNLAKHFNQH